MLSAAENAATALHIPKSFMPPHMQKPNDVPILLGLIRNIICTLAGACVNLCSISLPPPVLTFAKPFYDIPVFVLLAFDLV